MSASRGDLLGRLDTAMAAWDHQVSDAYRALCDRVSRAQEQVLLLRQDAQSRDADRTALQETRGRLTALQEEIARRDAETSAARQRLTRLAEENASLLERVRHVETERAHAEQVSDTVTGELSGRVAQLERELAAARDDASARTSIQDGVQEARNALASERIRADLLQEQLRDAREAGSRADSEQLAAALRDRDEAHQQIVALRAEIDLLRRMNASLSAPAPQGPAAETEAPPVSATDVQGRKRRMGEVLVELGVVSHDQVESALHEQAGAPQRRLGTILVEKGFASEEAIARIVARQLGLAFVRLTPDVVDAAATRIIGGALARRRNCLPIGVSSERVVLAMANPLDLITIDDVELASGHRVEPVVATAGDMASAVERYYGDER
ncbi:MAG: hypothetical protein NTU83_07635 [Candidatus Hydrogenedentes bacterium]|nr:hypothetical protein [Candidatus Hydrogenedentota bacterium]